MPLMLAGCVGTLPQPVSDLAQNAPVQWFAPFPHVGGAAQLAEWWHQPGSDATLATLIDAALQDAPTVAAAEARVRAARAQLSGQQAGLGPRLDAAASASRGNSAAVGTTAHGAGLPIVTTLQAGLTPHSACSVPGSIRHTREVFSAPGKPFNSPM